ncbi:MAG: hypothetical protein AAGJ18_30270 [Bacteroidota bacterium]
MKEIFDDLKSAIWKDDRLYAMRQIAQTEQFQLKERARFGEQPNGLKGCQLFQGKRGKRLKNILYKIDRNTSLKTRIYDYTYFGDSKNRTSTVIEFYLPQWNFSPALIRPKGNLHKMKSFFGKKPLIFNGLKNFHRKYQIASPDVTHLVYELNEDFLELLANQQQIWVELNGNFILFYTKHKLIPIPSLMDQYEYVLDLLDCLLYGHSNEEFV